MSDAAEIRARALMAEVAPPEVLESYERLGFISVPGRGDANSGYAYLVYPYRPLIAYDTRSGELLSEYCVAFRDGDERLPAADDVLAKWIAIRGAERELIETANLDPPGRQVDRGHARRDIARLRELDAERSPRSEPDPGPILPPPASA